MFDQTLASFISATGRHPVLESLAIIGGTFVLEDAATILAAAQVQSNTVPAAVALTSLYVGIVLGDLGLYGLGRLAAMVPWACRLIPPAATRRGHDWLAERLVRVVFISRFLPGARLPTYTACGFLGADFWRFAATAVVATLIWTTLLFSLSLRIGTFLGDNVGQWRWLGMAGFAVVVVLLGRAAAHSRQAAER
jgi:membrane protein DedA with SNARE-associated domain